MKSGRQEYKWKDSIICAAVLGFAAVMGIGTGGRATEAHKTQITEVVTEDMAADVWCTETESESESESEAFTETESESESESEALTETESESEVESEELTESESETESEALTETESESETESETLTETESESETESEALTETESESETESEALTETESESETESEALTETESESERESETLTEIESESETESEVFTESESETESETEVVLESEIKPEKPERVQIYRGKDYEISGEQNACFRDANGKLWVRSGTGIQIEPKNGNISEQRIGIQNLQEDGVLTFSLQKKDKNGSIVKESAITQEYYYVDGEVPAAEIHIDGNRSDGMIFSTAGTSASVQVAPDTRSGMKKVFYRVIPWNSDGISQEISQNTVWQEWEIGNSISLPEEGKFQIFVRTEDQVGNVAFTGSKPVCVDLTPPMIEIKGVLDQTANAGELPISVICKDSAYAQGSLEVTIQGVNSKRGPEVQNRQEKTDGAVISFYDFPQEQMYDDVYRMTVSASDKAGNRTEKTLEFSVNRYGSVYKLSEPTIKELEAYYISEGKDVVFYETNIDYIGESSVYIRHNGELKELKRGLDYQVTMSGSENTWKRYSYTVPADCFQEEGIYELLLTSVDRANNTSDTGLQEQSVAFVLDHTVPDVIISGIEENQVYQSETVTAAVTPSDAGGVKYVSIYINGELEQEYTEVKTDETIYFLLKEKPEWQNIQICAADMAGNIYRSEEIPVLISREEVPVKNDTAELHKNQLSVSDSYQKNTDKSRDLFLNKKSNLAENSREQIFLWSGIVTFILTVAGCIVMKKRQKK